MNVTQTPAAAPKADKFTLGGYARQEARQVLTDYKDAFVGTGQGLAEGFRGLRDAEGLGASLKAGISSGFKVGTSLGHLAAVPVGVFITATHGLWALPLLGAVGGLHIGCKTGEVMGRLATADEPDSKKHKVAALTGAIGGGAAGAVLGIGSPVAAAVGAVTALASATKLAGALVGGVAGGVIGFATWGVKKAMAAFNKPPSQGEQPPAPPAQGDPAPPAQGEPAPPTQGEPAPPTQGEQPPAPPAQGEQPPAQQPVQA